MGLAGKTKRRTENLIAWLFAAAILTLLALGAMYVLQAVGVIG